MNFEESVKKLLDCYQTDESVLGVILVGSTGKGYQDDVSDVDLEVVVTGDKFDELENNGEKLIHTETYDLIYTTIDRLQQVKESEDDEDHWWYRNCPVLLDKTGKLKGILEEIARYDTDSRLDRLKRYYLAFWQEFLFSIGCLRHKNEWGAKIYAASAIKELIKLLFNLNFRWCPRIQWAFKEIPMLERRPINFESKIESILRTPNSDELVNLWEETARLLREENYSWVDHPEEIL